MSQTGDARCCSQTSPIETDIYMFEECGQPYLGHTHTNSSGVIIQNKIRLPVNSSILEYRQVLNKLELSIQHTKSNG